MKQEMHKGQETNKRKENFSGEEWEGGGLKRTSPSSFIVNTWKLNHVPSYRGKFYQINQNNPSLTCESFSQAGDISD